MEDIDKALEGNSIRELIAWYYTRAQETMDIDEHRRCLATIFYLTAYNKLPF